MAANPNDLAYFARGEIVPFGKSQSSVIGFDHFVINETVPFAAPLSGGVTQLVIARKSKNVFSTGRGPYQFNWFSKGRRSFIFPVGFSAGVNGYRILSETGSISVFKNSALSIGVISEKAVSGIGALGIERQLASALIIPSGVSVFNEGALNLSKAAALLISISSESSMSLEGAPSLTAVQSGINVIGNRLFLFAGVPGLAKQAETSITVLGEAFVSAESLAALTALSQSVGVSGEKFNSLSGSPTFSRPAPSITPLGWDGLLVAGDQNLAIQSGHLLSVLSEQRATIQGVIGADLSVSISIQDNGTIVLLIEGSSGLSLSVPVETVRYYPSLKSAIIATYSLTSGV